MPSTSTSTASEASVTAPKDVRASASVASSSVSVPPNSVRRELARSAVAPNPLATDPISAEISSTARSMERMAADRSSEIRGTWLCNVVDARSKADFAETRASRPVARVVSAAAIVDRDVSSVASTAPSVVWTSLPISSRRSVNWVIWSVARATVREIAAKSESAESSSPDARLRLSSRVATRAWFSGPANPCNCEINSTACLTRSGPRSVSVCRAERSDGMTGIARGDDVVRSGASPSPPESET